jgi:hypothetical protein
VGSGRAAFCSAIRKADVKSRSSFAQPKPAKYEPDFCTLQVIDIAEHKSGAEILIYATASNSLPVIDIARQLHASDVSFRNWLPDRGSKKISLFD